MLVEDGVVVDVTFELVYRNQIITDMTHANVFANFILSEVQEPAGSELLWRHIVMNPSFREGHPQIEAAAFLVSHYL